MRLKVFFKVRLGWKNIKIIDDAENIKNTYSAFPVQKKTLLDEVIITFCFHRRSDGVVPEAQHQFSAGCRRKQELH